MKANKILLGTCLAGMLATSGAYAGYMCDWFGVWCDDSSVNNSQLAPQAPVDIVAPAPVMPVPAPDAANVPGAAITPPPVAPAPTPAPVVPAPDDVTAPAEDNTAVMGGPAPEAAAGEAPSMPGNDGMNTEASMPE